jgi:ABC-type Fe3+/spermidine/putrescine transport system ATPase subunit
LYERPQTRFVAEFIGSMNFLPGRTLAAAAGGAPVAVEAMGCRLEAVSPAALPAGAAVQVAFRPERSHLGAPDTGGLNLRGVIAHQVYLGTRIELHVEMAGGVRCIADLPNDGRPHRFTTGEAVTVAAAATDCRVFAA